MADQIKIPVTLDLLGDSAKQVVANIRKELTAGLKGVTLEILNESARVREKPMHPSVTAENIVRSKGRSYSVTATAKPGIDPTSGFPHPEMEPQISIAIKEVKEAIADSFKLDLKRISDIKRKIKHTSLEHKKNVLESVLEEEMALREAVSKLEPPQALDEIRRRVESSKNISSPAKTRYMKELEDTKDTFGDSDLGTQQSIIESFVERLSDFEGELADKLHSVTRTINREKLTELRTKTAGLDPAEKIAAFQKFIITEGVMVDEVRAMIRLESKKLLDLGKSNDLKKLEELRTKIAMQVPEAQVNSVDEFLKENPEMPDYLKMKARNMKFRAQDKMSGNKFSSLLEAIKNMNPDEALEEVAKYVREGGPLVEKTELLRKRLLDKKKGFDWKQLNEKAAFEKPADAMKLFIDYLNNGGAFAQRAKNKVRMLSDQQSNVDWKELAESAKLMNPSEAITAFEKYIKDGGAFVKRAKARINSEVSKLSSKSFSQLKLDIATMAPDDAIKAIQKFAKGLDKQLPSNAIEAKRTLRQKAEIEIAKLSDKSQADAYQALRNTLVGLDPKESLKHVQKFIDNASGKMKSRAEALYRQLGDKVVGLDWKRVQEFAKYSSPDEAVKAFQDYLAKGGAYTKRAAFEIKRLEDKKMGLDWRAIRSRAQDPDADLGVVIRELTDFAKKSQQLGGNFTQQAVSLRNRLRDRKAKTGLSDVLEAAKLGTPATAMSMIQDYIDNGGKFVRKAQIEWNKYADKLDSSKWKDTTLEIASMKPADAIVRVQKYLNDGGQLVKVAEARIRKLTDNMNARDWAKIKREAELDPHKGLADTRDYIKNAGAFLDEAKLFEKKLERRIDSKNWDEVRRSLKGHEPEKQKQLLTDWAKAANPQGEWKDKFEAELRSIDKRDAASKKKIESERVSSWKEFARGLNIEDRLKEIDRVINDPATSTRMKNAAKNLQQTALNNQRMNRERAAKMAHKAFADSMLIAGGVGVGLFGAAGFPLLNVGFAAMSGGPVGGGLAALATAIGESLRALEGFTAANVAAAKSIGAVSINYKLIETEREAMRGIAGIAPMTAEMIGLRRRIDAFDGSQSQGMAGYAGTAWQSLVEGFKTKFSTLPDRKVSPMDFILPQNYLRRFLEDASKEGSQVFTDTYKELPKEAKLAYEAMLAQANKPTTRIENDPYQTWLRMQNAAFDPTKETQSRLMQKMIETAQEQLKKLYGIEVNTAKPRATPQPVGG